MIGFRTVPTPAVNNQAANRTFDNDVSSDLQTDLRAEDPGLNNAIFRYETANNTEPTTPVVPSQNPLVEANLIPLENPGAPNGTVIPVPLTLGLNVCPSQVFLG